MIKLSENKNTEAKSSKRRHDSESIMEVRLKIFIIHLLITVIIVLSII